MNSQQTPPPAKHEGQPGAEPSRNVFVRFQQGFERRFNQFREQSAQKLCRTPEFYFARRFA